MMHTTGPIVVGYDGSPDAQTALSWAIREAASRHLAIRIIFCEPDVSPWDSTASAIAGSPILAAELPRVGAEILEPALQQVTAAGIPVEGMVESLPPSPALVQASREASMVVIGSRGLGSVSSAFLGSTGSHVASHARCPVIVVRSEGTVDGPVVVGVDGSAQSEQCVGWAIDHASRHGLPLEVLHAYAIPVYPGVVPYVPPEEITRATADFEDRLVHEVLAGWREQYPEVEIRTRVFHGRPAPALIEASEHASLTVVGSHGRGAFLGMLLGSTSQSLLHHAKGSVAILRYRRPD